MKVFVTLHAYSCDECKLILLQNEGSSYSTCSIMPLYKTFMHVFASLAAGL